jgi:hypothetical protein
MPAQEFSNFEISNGLVGLNRRVLLKLLYIGGEKYMKELDELVDYFETPNFLKNIIGLSNETYRHKRNWFFKELVEDFHHFWVPNPRPWEQKYEDVINIADLFV